MNRHRGIKKEPHLLPGCHLIPSRDMTPSAVKSSHEGRQRGQKDQHSSPSAWQVTVSGTSNAVTNLLSIPKLEFNRNTFVTLSITNLGEMEFS